LRKLVNSRTYAAAWHEHAPAGPHYGGSGPAPTRVESRMIRLSFLDNLHRTLERVFVSCNLEFRASRTGPYILIFTTLSVYSVLCSLKQEDGIGVFFASSASIKDHKWSLRSCALVWRLRRLAPLSLLLQRAVECFCEFPHIKLP
jgi:hypothetical protein